MNLYRSRALAAIAVAFMLPLEAPAQGGNWRLSPYPAGHRFAFTIVHDADSAYSRRLAPLFEEFDALHMKLTVTSFVFWADWARDGAIWSEWRAAARPRQPFFQPIAVPLVDPEERRFYLGLAARGYEIGMHSASETSDTTAQTVRAFATFTQIFGHPPAVYVEHSAANNKEALNNQGADPHSPYYILGVLRQYQPWVWIDGPGGMPSDHETHFFDLAAIPSAPFCPELAQRYGLERVFMRSGKFHTADGNAFLEWYTQGNIDQLVQNRGLALVYTHLDKQWLDPGTRKMRTPLHERLAYLVSNDGWFFPAGAILDRLVLMRKVSLQSDGKTVHIANRNAAAVDSISAIAPAGAVLCRGNRVYRPNASGAIVVGPLHAGETAEWRICR